MAGAMNRWMVENLINIYVKQSDSYYVGTDNCLRIDVNYCGRVK